jgi:hypothetical protein
MLFIIYQVSSRKIWDNSECRLPRKSSRVLLWAHVL